MKKPSAFTKKQVKIEFSTQYLFNFVYKVPYMKNNLLLTLFLVFLGFGTKVQAQSFSDDFESYNNGDYLAQSSTVWTTWNNNPGSSEDVQVSNSDAYSGSNSIYFESQNGGGPQDVVLPFGGRHTTGHFKLSSMWKIAANTGAYFNLQGGTTTGSSWALDFYFWDYGYWDAGGVWGTYPQDQWFEVVIDIDLDNNIWEIFVDGVSAGTFSNFTNAVSFMDIYPLFYGTKFWVDDVKYCKDAGCLTDMSVDQVVVNTQPLCSNHFADVDVTLTNNGPDPGESITLGFQTEGGKTISRVFDLNGLGVGKSVTLNINDLYKTNLNGNNLDLRVYSVLGDKNNSNNEQTIQIDVVKSPSDFEITKGSTFQGLEGQNGQPDMIEVGKTNVYQFNAPGGFTNSNFPSQWTVGSIVVKTSSGVTVPSSAYTYTPPSSSNNGTISFTGSSAYLDSVLTFNLAIKSQSTGCDSTATRKVRIVPTPKTDFSFNSPVCKGDDILFQNNTTIHSGNFTCHWSFGDGDTSDVVQPVHVYKTSGTFTVKLTATSFPYGIKKDTSIQITVNEIPNAKFKVNNKCQGIAIEFVNQSTIGSGTIAYTWDFGDNTANSSVTNPTHLYAAAGNYKATLKASSNGCSSSFTRTAISFPKPSANFTPPSGSVCANTEIIMDNQSTVPFGKLGTFWNFGDGNSSTQFNAHYTYTASGTYNVKLISVSEFDCRDSITKQVNIIKSPKPDFTTDYLCSEIPSHFRNATIEEIPNPIYTWTFSDGAGSSLKNVTKTWNAPGPKSATLKAKYSNGCEAEISKSFTVLLQPIANFETKDICNNETALFVNKSIGEESAIKYKWDFGDGDFSTIANPSNTYPQTTTTTYTVSLVASYDGGCSDTMRKSVAVSESPVCDFTYKQLGFRKTQFTPSNTGYTSYEWTFGEGGASDQPTPTYNYLYSGNFNVTMKATNAGGCNCEITKRVSANLGINDQVVLYGLSIYPNPSNGVFTVSNEKREAMTIEVYNTLGESIQLVANQEGTAEINLGEVASGFYMVKVTIGGISQTYKISVSN
ncbi:MAG TPA: PKD domain-containing protein [Bacteroidia bacterium]